MERYRRKFKESLSSKERKELEREVKNIRNIIKNSPFIDPKNMSRERELTSLLLTDGEEKDLTFKTSKRKKSKRVTPFTRYRT